MPDPFENKVWCNNCERYVEPVQMTWRDYIWTPDKVEQGIIVGGISGGLSGGAGGAILGILIGYKLATWVES